jgi:SWI/SNF-related matrix-associated actin-dependent regulator of chromatin subfamily A3
MAPRKRKSDVVGLTDDNEARAAKVNRPTPYLDPQDISNGERFGESTDFIPLTQVPGADEDDAQATELVEGSQDVDEPSPSSSMLYGKL